MCRLHVHVQDVFAVDMHMHIPRGSGRGHLVRVNAVSICNIHGACSDRQQPIVVKCYCRLLLPKCESEFPSPLRDPPSHFVIVAMAAPHGAAAAAAAAAAANPAALQLAAAVAGVGAGDDPAAVRLTQLQQDQQRLAAQKRTNTQLIKNELKKKQRLKDKARQLSTQELQEVLVSRAAAEATAKAKAKAKPKPKAKAKAVAAPAAMAPPLAMDAAGGEGGDEEGEEGAVPAVAGDGE